MFRHIQIFSAGLGILLLSAGCQSVLKTAEGVAGKVIPSQRKTSGNAGKNGVSRHIAWQGSQGKLTCKGRTFEIKERQSAAAFEGTRVTLPVTAGSRSSGDDALPEYLFRAVAEPLLAPAAPAAKVRCILLDAGHGGSDAGATGPGKTKEKDLNLALARRVRKHLEQRGFKVVMTRDRDVFIPLAERSTGSRAKGTQLFISIHHNAAVNRALRGYEVFALRPEPKTRIFPGSTRLAWCIQKRLAKPGTELDRGVKFSRFKVLVTAETPAVLVEAGFVSNPDEEKLIRRAREQERVASAIANAVAEYAAGK